MITFGIFFKFMEVQYDNFINCLNCDKRCYLNQKIYDHFLNFKLEFYCDNCLKKIKHFDFCYEVKEEEEKIVLKIQCNNPFCFRCNNNNERL